MIAPAIPAGAVQRGVRNAFRNRTRTVAVIVLLALVVGALAVMIQAALWSRQQIATLEARVRTLIELRQAGAFGTGGFGGDRPIGEEGFTTGTLAAVLRIPSARHLARVDEYVYTPQIDARRPNAYAMVIGLQPGAALRAIGEVDYENARIIAGRPFRTEDAGERVAIVGRLYAWQRLGMDPRDEGPLPERMLSLNGAAFRVIGVYATGNDFGDNHVFIPIESFRAVYLPGNKLSKIFVTVDSVANVERVVEDLKQIPEADVVTTPEAVSTARMTLGGLAAASVYAVALLLTIGIVLVVFVMVLGLRERVSEIGTLKAIGASNREIIGQLAAEAATLCALGGVGAIIVAAAGAGLLRAWLALPLSPGAGLLFSIAAGAVLFAIAGSLYPIIKARRLSPVEAMRSAE
jgi:putative ABC transport system permease protein